MASDAWLRARRRNLEALRVNLIDLFGEAAVNSAESELNLCVLEPWRGLAYLAWHSASESYDPLIRQYGKLVIEVTFRSGEHGEVNWPSNGEIV